MSRATAQYCELTRAPCQTGLISYRRWPLSRSAPPGGDQKEVSLIRSAAGAAAEGGGLARQTDRQTAGLRADHKWKPSQAEDRTLLARSLCVLHEL